MEQAKSYIRERDKKFADFFSQKHQRMEIQCRIVGYDPMNISDSLYTLYYTRGIRRKWADVY